MYQVNEMIILTMYSFPACIICIVSVWQQLVNIYLFLFCQLDRTLAFSLNARKVLELTLHPII